jgi:hypothetical protein
MIASLTIAPSTVIGGQPAIGTVTLTAPAPAGGVQVSLSSSNFAATVPPSILVLAGQTMATFPVATLPVLSSTTVTITASAANSVSATLTVNPIVGGQPGTIGGLTISPSRVTGGLPAIGTVTLTAPAVGIGVQVILSSGSLAAIVPPSVIVLAGQTTATFPVATLPVSSSTMVTITASAANTASATLTVNALVTNVPAH